MAIAATNESEILGHYRTMSFALTGNTAANMVTAEINLAGYTRMWVNVFSQSGATYGTVIYQVPNRTKASYRIIQGGVSGGTYKGVENIVQVDPANLYPGFIAEGFLPHALQIRATGGDATSNLTLEVYLFTK